jgi:hypothetical protein
MEIKLNKFSGPFSLEHTLNCGQLFRWKKLEDWWYGVVSNRVIKIKQNKDILIFVQTGALGVPYLIHLCNIQEYSCNKKNGYQYR